MSLKRWATSTLLVFLSGIAGCAGLPPAPPAVPTPQDLIQAIPQGNNTTLVNVAPPAPQHMTLPEFLGITRCRFAAQSCCFSIRNQVAFCFTALA
jgi:hypothetical protein